MMTSSRRISRPKDFGAGLRRAVLVLVLGIVVVDRGQGTTGVLSSQGDESHLSDMMDIIWMAKVGQGNLWCRLLLLDCLFVYVIVCGCQC